MPTEDVSDLRDVVDAINRLCDNMKNSYDENGDDSEVIMEEVNSELVDPVEVVVRKVETHVAENWVDPLIEDVEAVILENTETVVVRDTEDVIWEDTDNVILEDTQNYIVEDAENVTLKDIEAEILEDTEVMLDVETVSDTEQTLAPCEPLSEMYFTASSEMSLFSETDVADKLQNEDSDKEKDVRNSVIAGHVAAMRERFESMTRANTPCPDLIRSLSPSLDMFRNITPSPDFLDKS